MTPELAVALLALSYVVGAVAWVLAKFGRVGWVAT